MTIKKRRLSATLTALALATLSTQAANAAASSVTTVRALVNRQTPALQAPLSASERGWGRGSLRPPAVPLVTVDPYLSIWSKSDNLTDDVTRHWTGRPQSLMSMIRVDDRAYRLMGQDPAGVPAFPQTSLQVLPTRSIYTFANAQVKVKMTFLTPLLPSDLDVFSRPLTYITWTVSSVDGIPHAVSIYDSTSSQVAVNRPAEIVHWSREKHNGLLAMRAGTVEQPILGSAGDDHQIDWGYVYTVAPSTVTQAAIGDSNTVARTFVDKGTLPGSDDTGAPRASNDHEPAMAFVYNLGKVTKSPVSRHVMVAYDEIYAIDYFGKHLRPYWRRNGAQPHDLFAAAEHDYNSLNVRSAQFDSKLMADMTKVGGAKYAQIAALAYRQAVAACGLAADRNKKPLLFTKENSSNGDIGTVDVFFPMDPIWVFLSPTLAKATLVPIFSYAASPHWKFPNAPHDLGTYPLAYGTDDGGEGMPVEESGNMLLIADAIAHDDGNADFVKPWWPQITQWAKYLEQYGLDPEDQLCTDDFMGHLAHNTNLSVKAILALAAYGDLCKMRGETAEAKRYHDLAIADAKHWVEVADQGDHSTLAFDKPGTWSQKYNLVWDRILGLNIFPSSVAAKEVAYYKKVMNPYGVPLDSRTTTTKNDWSMWSATLATNRSDFEALVDPIYGYLNVTTNREPLRDWYDTVDEHSGNFRARPVVGGMFIKMLDEPTLWHKWSKMDKADVTGWAPLPAAPMLTDIVPTSQKAGIAWRYTTNRPPDDWTDPGFDDSAWQFGNAPFASAGTPSVNVGTSWTTDDIWIRHTVTLPSTLPAGDINLVVYHDEDTDIYFNGVLAAKIPGYQNSYSAKPIRPDALALLTPGAHITIAAHCHQTGGGQGLDIGIAASQKEEPGRLKSVSPPPPSL